MAAPKKKRASDELDEDYTHYEFDSTAVHADEQGDSSHVDILRDTPARYLGYANEIGEAFKPVLRMLYLPSYALAAGYVVADTYDKAMKAEREGSARKRMAMMSEFAEQEARKQAKGAGIGAKDTEKAIEQVRLMRAGASPLATKDVPKQSPSVTAAALDTLLWQGFASVALPGFAINRVVAATQAGINALKPLAESSVSASAAQLRSETPVLQALRSAARAIHAGPGATWIPTVVGLSTIPFIVEPLDTFVHRIMDRHVRPRLGVPPHYGHEGASQGAEHLLMEAVGLGKDGSREKSRDASAREGGGSDDF